MGFHQNPQSNSLSHHLGHQEQVSSFSLTPLPWIRLPWLLFHGILTCSNLCPDSQNYEKSSLYSLSLLPQPSPTPNTFPSGLHYSCDTPLAKVSNSLLDTQSHWLLTLFISIGPRSVFGTVDYNPPRPCLTSCVFPRTSLQNNDWEVGKQVPKE